jgi:beta-N-acetylhexosaminidase
MSSAPFGGSGRGNLILLGPGHLRGQLRRWIAPTTAIAVCCALAACHAGSGERAAQTTTVTSSTSPPASAPPPRATSSAPAACTNLKVIDSWPVARRGAQLVVVPALNARLTGLGPSFAAGAGGVVILGPAAPGTLGGAVVAANRGEPAGVPLAVMSDEEGGGVQRLAGMVGSLPWPRQMAATMTPDQVSSLARQTAARMVAVGVNVDLAPVLDVDGGPGPNSQNPDGLRSFSAIPAVASRYGLAFAAGLQQGGVLSVVKHFPGLGGSDANTDVGPAATLPLATLRTQGLLPFQAAIAAGTPAVMVANATVPGLSTGPASLSSAVIQGLLRGTLGFHGLVLTDSLSAGAISATGLDLPGAAVAAVAAGADMVLFGSTLTPAAVAALSPPAVNSSMSAIVNALVSAVGSGRLTTARLDAAVLDVLTAKRTTLCPR